MKHLIIILATFLGCGYSSAQILYPEPLYEEMDTIIVINRNDKGSFFCNYWSNDYCECHIFKIEFENFRSEIAISSQDDYHYLDALEICEKKYSDGKGEEPEAYFQPYLHFWFYFNNLAFSTSDLERRNESYIPNPGDDCCENDFSRHWKYIYNMFYYSKENHHLILTGKELNYFSNTSFDFIVGDGVPYGKWQKKFKGPVIKKAERKAGKPDYILNNRHRDFQNETCVLKKPLRWSQTESNLMFEFRTKDSKVFYFDVDYKKKPYVKQATIEYPDSLIEYKFATNGRLATYAIEKEAGYEIYYYDTKKGYLLKKQTGTKDSPDTYLEEIFDIRREYEKELIAPEESLSE